MPALPLWLPVLVAVLQIMLANANPLLRNPSRSFLFLAWPLLAPALLSLPLSQVPVLYVLVPTLLRRVVLALAVQGVVLEEAEEEEAVIRDQQRPALRTMAAMVATVLLVPALLLPIAVLSLLRLSHLVPKPASALPRQRSDAMSLTMPASVAVKHKLVFRSC